jgi:acyl-coenzyme A thioesterase PaaI-like protein
MTPETVESEPVREVVGRAPFSYQQHLGIVLDAAPGRSIASLEARPDLCVAPGVCRLGVLATLVDCAAGMSALFTLEPAWTATVDLVVHSLSPFVEPRLDASSTVVKRRRSGLVLDVQVTDSVGTLVGTAIGSFAEMPQQHEPGLTFATRGVGPLTPQPVGASPRPIDEHVLIRTEELDRYALDLHEGVRNTSNALLGGAAALLIETAAQRSVSQRLRRGAVATGLEVHFLAPGRVGPIDATTTVLRSAGPGGWLVRVQLVDRGADDRLMAVALVTVQPDAPND